MKFETGATIFEEGSPASRFYLILTGRVVLSSEMEDRNVIPIQTLGPGDDLGWSWLFPPYDYALHSSRLGANHHDLFLWDKTARTVRTGS
jgi:hypothetical protein